MSYFYVIYCFEVDWGTVRRGALFYPTFISEGAGEALVIFGLV